MNLSGNLDGEARGRIANLQVDGVIR